MSKQLNRRIFLRGLGGACVAAPFLTSLKSNRAQAAASGPPKRLIMMFTHYGCITNKFFPASSHGPLTAASLEPTTLKHLAPFAAKLLLPRGIRSMNEWTASMNRGQGNDPHTQVAGSFFTCQPVTPNSNDPFSFNRATKFDAKPTGPSLDHVMAKQLSPNGAPMFMRVGNATDSPQSAISYSAAETAFPGLGTPAQAFSSLTGLFMNGMTPTNPDTYRVARGKSVIDVVREDLNTLERFDMSATDRQKLAAWKELLTSTGGTVVTAQCSQDIATMLGATQQNVDAVRGGVGSDILTTKVNNTTMDGADIYSNVAVLAAICNANPVILMKYPPSYVFRGLSLTTEAHSLSHRIGNAGMSGTCVAGVLEMLLKIDDYYAQKFARLVQLLDSVAEGDGKVLDNSAAIWFNEMSDGNAHNLNNSPIVQAGSLGGYFKTGQSINVENGMDDPNLRGRSESVCAEGTSTMVNGTTQSTGTVATAGNAPINKYFVNIMNAMGVKAGADGFPADGGTAEVTKFGKYDKTEDFIGGNKPANITSPGGFDALKA
jgi:hypothetical protein